MARTVNLSEAKTRLSQLIDDAAAGEEIIIAKKGKPKARLGPLPAAKRKRKSGGWRRQVWIAEDFDDELPAVELTAWYGEDTGRTS